MDISILLIGVGIVIMIISFFFKDRTKKLEREIEDLSLNVFQETNNLKRRIKIVEEELLLEPTFNRKEQPSQLKVNIPSVNQTAKPIHSILISQVVELNKQGLSIEEISARSTLSAEQIRSILASGGAR